MDVPSPCLCPREKRAFLRKGTGLLRFFKDVDIGAHFRQMRVNGSEEEEWRWQGQQLPQPPLHRSLKSSDSPRRHLNVSFAKALPHNSPSEEEDGGKEKAAPNSLACCELVDGGDEWVEGGSSDEDDWATEDEQTDDEAESEVELSESAVLEVVDALREAEAHARPSATSEDGMRSVRCAAPTSTPHPPWSDLHSWVRASAAEARKHSVRIVAGAAGVAGEGGRSEDVRSRVQAAAAEPLSTRILQLEADIAQHRHKNQELRELRLCLEKECSEVGEEQRRFERVRTQELGVIRELKERLEEDRAHVGGTSRQLSAQTASGEERSQELATLRAEVALLQKDVKVRLSRRECSARIFRATIEALRKDKAALEQGIAEAKALKTRRDVNARAQGRLRTKRFRALLPSTENVVPGPAVGKSVALRLSKASLQHVAAASESLKTCVVEEAKGRAEAVAEKREVREDSGTRRILSASGDCLEIHYANGDIKDLSRLHSHGISNYFFKEAQAWESIHPDGTQELTFATGDVERKLPGGVCEVEYASGVSLRIFPDGTEEVLLPDKTLIRTQSDGGRELHLPNGQVEFHTKQLKIRSYPDGTEKVLYNNGATLTTYASGRQRFRDPAGQMVYDRLGSEATHSHAPS